MKAFLKFVPIALFMAACIACSSSPTAPGVTVATAEAATTTPNAMKASTPVNATEFLASGPIVVEDQVDVAAQRDGMVTRVLAEPGARAKTRSTEDDLKNWEAEAKVLDSDYARAEKMWEAQIIPKEQLEHARYKAESDQWDVKRVSELLTNAKQAEHSLELELEKTQVTAPFNGVVARRYVRAGQTVARNDRLFWVTAVAPLRIRVTLPEKFLGRIRSGTMMAVTATEGAAPDRRYRARVIQVSPVVDPSSDTIEVLAELFGDTSGLRPGMRADVHVPDVK